MMCVISIQRWRLSAWAKPIVCALASVCLLAACHDAPRSRAADVPGVDVRRLPPARKLALPDVMFDQSDRGRVLGVDAAPVKVLVVSDYQCPTCRTWFEQTLPAIRAAYIDSGRVQLTWVHYPLREHPRAVRAATAALCAGVQGHFWEASARLFAAQARWAAARDAAADATIDSLVSVAGVDNFSLRDCTQSGRLLRRVRADIDWADTARTDAPPLVVIGRRRVAGAASLATLRAVIDSALAGK